MQKHLCRLILVLALLWIGVALLVLLIGGWVFVPWTVHDGLRS